MTSPTGHNNLLIKDVNMTNVFAPLNGEWVLKQVKSNRSRSTPRYYTVLQQLREGSMSPDEFNATMRDLVNFLVYSSDPSRITREHIGYWVLGFLIAFAVLCFFLYKSFWQGVD